jgi:hypothetical protein
MAAAVGAGGGGTEGPADGGTNGSGAPGVLGVGPRRVVAPVTLPAPLVSAARGLAGGTSGCTVSGSGPTPASRDRRAASAMAARALGPKTSSVWRPGLRARMIRLRDGSARRGTCRHHGGPQYTIMPRPSAKVRSLRPSPGPRSTGHCRATSGDDDVRVRPVAIDAPPPWPLARRSRPVRGCPSDLDHPSARPRPDRSIRITVKSQRRPRSPPAHSQRRLRQCPHVHRRVTAARCPT